MRHPILDHFKQQQAQNNYNVEKMQDRLDSNNHQVYANPMKEFLENADPIKHMKHFELSDLNNFH